jgi:methanogenic corrinoid protein MtbC1
LSEICSDSQRKRKGFPLLSGLIKIFFAFLSTSKEHQSIIKKNCKLQQYNYHILKMNPQTPYIPKNKVRIVTAAALFDGHDAAINIMRRIIQSTGVEVIHLGHDRSVDEVVNTAIQEDADCFDILSGRSYGVF